jgi:4-hydroxy-tetrahydrodipicolinate synthase
MNRREFLGLAAAAAAAGLAQCGPSHPVTTSTATQHAKDFSTTHGIVPPVITPFTPTGAIDWNAWDALLDWHIEHGVSGLFVNSLSGGIYTLENDEMLRLARTALKRADGRVKVIAGSTPYPYGEIAKNIDLTRSMTDTGVDACVVSTPRSIPLLYRLSIQNPVTNYYLAIHDAVDCDLHAYEIPGSARFHFSPESFARLAAAPRFVGIKDTSTHGRQSLPRAIDPVRRKLVAAKKRMNILQANTPYLLASLQAGCTGGINTTANVAPGLLSRMYSLWKAGDMDGAERLQREITEIDKVLMRDDYGMAARIVVNMLGVPVGNHRRRGGSTVSSERMTELYSLARRIHEAEKSLGA